MKRIKISVLAITAIVLTSCSSGWKCTKHYGSAEKHKIERKAHSPYQ